MTYISTANFTSNVRQSILQTESNLSNVQKQIASGVYADLGLQLGSQTSNAISLSQQSDQLTALTQANAVVTTRLSATSSSLDTIMSTAQSFSNTLLEGITNGGISDTSQQQATSNIQSFISTVNTTVGGQYIFGGTNTANAPLKDAATNQTAVDTAVTSDLAAINSDPSQITASQITDYLASPSSAFAGLYQSPGWDALGSASTTALTSKISPSSTINTSVSAREAGFQQISQAYAMISDLSGKGLNPDAKKAVVTAAIVLMNKGIASITATQANIGVIQNNITNATTQMTTQQTLLTSNVAQLENTDATTLSTKMSALQTQLQASYSITNSLKSLSLVTYLTGG